MRNCSISNRSVKCGSICRQTIRKHDNGTCAILIFKIRRLKIILVDLDGHFHAKIRLCRTAGSQCINGIVQ